MFEQHFERIGWIVKLTEHEILASNRSPEIMMRLFVGGECGIILPLCGGRILCTETGKRECGRVSAVPTRQILDEKAINVQLRASRKRTRVA